MFKGLWALFASGLIFNPALLLGAFTGIIAYIALDSEHLKILYTDYHLYILFLLLSCLYVYFFQKTLQDNLRDIDWKETTKSMFKHFLLMSFSFIMGILFASFFDFSNIDIKPNPEDYQYSEISETINIQKQAEDMVKNYNSMLDSIK